MDELSTFLEQFGDIPFPSGKLQWLQNTLVALPRDMPMTEEPFVAGMILGRRTKGRFIPSFPLLDHVAKHTENTITVDEKTAYLFTCGRDIFGKQVLHKPDVKIVLVLNPHGEVMGMARNDIRKGMYMNILDRGIFLRQEMHKKR